MNEPFSVALDESDNLIRIRFHIPITRELARQCARQAMELDQQVNSNGCLIDVRGTPNVSSVSDSYELANEDLAAIEIPKYKRMAILINPTEDSHDFPLTALRDAGYNARMFSNEQQALAWLESE